MFFAGFSFLVLIPIVVIVGVVLAEQRQRSLSSRAETHASIALAVENARFEATLAGFLLERYMNNQSERLLPVVATSVANASDSLGQVRTLKDWPNDEKGAEVLALLADRMLELEVFGAAAENVSSTLRAGDEVRARELLESASADFGQFGQNLSLFASGQREEADALAASAQRWRSQLFWVLVGIAALTSLAVLGGAAPFGRSMMKRLTSLEGRAVQADYDIVTGLPNRLLLMDRLEIALARAKREERMVAVLFLDLDKFKVVNDTAGHQAGDAALRMVAEQLMRRVREGDTVARYGGDEFVLAVSDIESEAVPADIAQRVVTSLREPWLYDGYEFRLDASIGIARFPQDGTDAETLIKNADLEMYRAKSRDGNADGSVEKDWDSALTA